MTYIAKQVIKGKTYYITQRLERVNGEPRVVWRKRRGTVDDILRVYEGRHLDHIQFSAFDFGNAGAFLAIAEELDFVDIANEVVDKKATLGITPGEYLALIILGRCHGPYSKQGTAK